MNLRKETLHSIILLVSLAALAAESSGAPYTKRTANNEDNTNCTQRASSIYDILCMFPFEFKANVSFRVQTPRELWRQFKETAKEKSDVSVSGAFERMPEEMRACPGLQNLNTDVSGRSLCSWRYQCNFDPKRVPASIFTAEIFSESGNMIHTVVGRPQQYQCKPIYMPLNVLKLNCSTNGTVPEWKLVQEKVTVGFTAVAIMWFTAVAIVWMHDWFAWSLGDKNSMTFNTFHWSDCP